MTFGRCGSAVDKIFTIYFLLFLLLLFFFESYGRTLGAMANKCKLMEMLESVVDFGVKVYQFVIFALFWKHTKRKSVIFF